jgi:DNA-directed RNA polymerase subunit RPC12/RpoP
MARLYDSRPLLAHVDEQRAADIYRLAAMGDPKSALLWRDLSRDNPPLARLARTYAEKCAAKSAAATGVVDDVIVKGVKALAKNHDYMCLGCGGELDRGEKFCTGCGKENPGFTPLADRKLPMNKGAACSHCGGRVRARHQHCTECGGRNPFFIAKKGRGVGRKNKKAARVWKGTSAKVIKSVTHSQATNGVYTGTSRAMTLQEMMRQAANSPDPSVREPARQYLGLP